MEDYFSIEDILSAEPRLYCTFRVRGYHLGHLDPVGIAAAAASNPAPTQSTEESNPSVGNEEEDETLHVPVDHRLALPFWLSETLAERNFVALHMPYCFKKQTRNALRADASSVALHQLCASYYALGVRISKLVKDVSLPAVLGRAFANRCWRIVDNAVFSVSHGSQAVIKYDRLERRLFFASHGVNAGILRWKERTCDRIVAFNSVLGKRPRDADEEDANVGSPVTPANTTRVRVC